MQKSAFFYFFRLMRDEITLKNAEIRKFILSKNAEIRKFILPILPLSGKFRTLTTLKISCEDVFLKSAAKVLHQTNKTCQDVKEDYKKVHFCYFEQVISSKQELTEKLVTNCDYDCVKEIEFAPLK